MVFFYLYEKVRKKERSVARRMQKLLRVLFRIVKVLRNGAKKEKVDSVGRTACLTDIFSSHKMMIYFVITI